MAKGSKFGGLLKVAVFFLAVLYMLNLGVGVGEVFADFLPLIGNIDEFAASAIIIALAKGKRGGD